MSANNTVVASIHNLKRNLDELKCRQNIAWDNLQIYKTYSNNYYDISKTLAPNASQTFQLILTHELAKNNAILLMNVFYRIDNTDVMASPMPRFPPTNPHIYLSWVKTSADNTSTTWKITMKNITGGSDTYTGYAKIYIDGTDTGAWVIVEI
jgi:hypothetical protein